MGCLDAAPSVGWTPDTCHGQFWLLINDLHTNADMIALSAINSVLSSRSTAHIAVLSFLEPANYYRSQLQKLGAPINVSAENRKISFIDCLSDKELWDDYGFLQKTLQSLVEYFSDSQQRDNDILFVDGIDVLLDAAPNQADVIDFFRQLCDLSISVMGTIHSGIGGHQYALICLEDMADAHVVVGRLLTGYNPDIDGQIQVFRHESQLLARKPSDLLHFKRKDGSVTVRARGSITIH